MKVIIFLMAIIAGNAFAKENSGGDTLTHFVGGALYYEYVDFTLEHSGFGKKNEKKSLGGAGFSYDLLTADQFLFSLNMKSTYFMEKAQFGTEGYRIGMNAGTDVRFNYLISAINKNSGVFLGAGVGSSVFATGNTNNSVVINANLVPVVIGNIGFMHTLDDTPFMYNITASYEYGKDGGYRYNNVKVDSLQTFQVKVGFHYALK